ncbi:MAG: cryptochrome/photolyase family protein [Planctomycetota bacterium]|jgi:deoxyribodipyrimidine photolyase-related protein
MAKAFLILPHQLFKSLPDKDSGTVVLAEDRRYFSDFRFHKKKLVLHRASMKYYAHLLESRGYPVEYLDHETLERGGGLGPWFQKKKVGHISLYDPVDVPLANRLRKDFSRAGIELQFLESPSFLCEEESLRPFFEGTSHYSMNSFYIQQRKERQVLLEDGKPAGGQWSFDADNRKPLGRDAAVPKINFGRTNQYVKEAKEYVSRLFTDHPGQGDGFFYPVTHPQAERWLADFVENRLAGFGPYEDAISTEHRFLFHSLLSPLLNCGLLTPDLVLDKVLSYSKKHTVPLNSLEGFVRQVMGWREFMRAVYLLRGEQQRQANFWKFGHSIPGCFYDGRTGIGPVDAVIHAVLDNAYAHHIERLMILGNFMLLCEIHPKELYRWFMELFIDAYDWVMVPNVFGMSQYADGGTMTTKPYISSSNYVRKMSDYPGGSWCEVWDGLFWRFVEKHKTVFATNPRMKMMAVQLDRMDKQKLKKHTTLADAYLETLHND